MANIRIGCQLPQQLVEFEKIAAIAQQCEKLGYDSVWAYDHLSPFWRKRGNALEPWTLLAAIAQRTRTIKVGTLVTNVNLRSPALLGKMTSALDNLSGGRLIVGLGCGDRLSRKELESHGYKFASLDERIGRLRETIRILKAMWTNAVASFDGEYYKLSEAANNPKPTQKPHPPIWVGGKHHKILDVVSEMANGWNYWGIDDGGMGELNGYLVKKCKQLGRRLEDVEKSWVSPLDELFRTSENRRILLGKIRDEMRKHLAYGTNYFVGSFGAETEPWCFELFAQAATSLR